MFQESALSRRSLLVRRATSFAKMSNGESFQAPYPGGAVKPPIMSLRRAANSIDVASSQKGPMIWIPTGRPDELWPIGAVVAGQPVNVAVTIHGMSCI